METVSQTPDAASDPALDGEAETEAARQRRLAWEAERIAEARASAAAGRVVASARVKAWIDSIGSERELPVPFSGR
jgi:predicted transcriptional regulator